MDYTLDIVTWHEVKDQLRKLNPDIAEEIDQLPVNNTGSLKFVRARLPFGADIEKGNELWLYYKNKPINYDDPGMPSDIKNLLDYPWKGIPVGIVTHNTMEWHLNLPSHIVPIRIVKPGSIFSLYSLFEPAINHAVHGAYSSTAGCRSLVLLPKITHKDYSKRLERQFGNLQHILPKTFSQQWYLFHELSQSDNFQDPWYCEIILFTREVLDHLRDCLQLRHKFMGRIWRYTAFARNYAMYDLLWEIYAQGLKRSQRSPFIFETAKHVVKTAMGEVPCYSPAVNDNTAPVHRLTDIFLNVYRTRRHLPIFMQPDVYNGRHPVYYSLQKPTFFHPLPSRNNSARTVDEIAAIHALIKGFTKRVLSNNFPMDLTDTILYQRLQDVEIECFHSKGEDGLNANVDQLPEEDSRFMQKINEFSWPKKLSFPRESSFFNGCIRLRPANREVPKPSMKDFISMIGGNTPSSVE